ncbi:hypothetical protein Tco_1081417 [Tanacetum coccineum]|uniref:Transposase (Putative), gypsy type n=1 Tax=Tanacetum coccineum TaxID=301880 RepID=A0ABQ5HZK3_9ASTR
MAKKDTDLYHSRLTPNDLNDMIIKYKIPRDLHPRLHSKEFVMSELLDDAIGIYHRIFDFSGVRIPFSSFLLDLIKHYRVYFSHLGPLGLNKVITFESGFFLIDRRAIPDAMVWTHPDAAIDDTRPAAGSFNIADVRRLSAHVIKLRDIPEGVLVLSRLIMGIHDFLYLPEWTGAEVQEEPHLDILAKAKASQKRKASTSGASSSHVAKPTRSSLAQSFGSTTRPSLFASDDDESDDDDACVEISLVTPLCSATVIPSSRNQGGSFVAPTAEGSNTRDSRGKGIMVDDASTPSGGVSRQRPSSRPAPSFRDVFGDAIHTDFFPFFAVLMKEVSKDPAICKTIVDQFPIPGEMVQVKGLSDDQLTAKMSLLHCMMMSHGGELLARHRRLNQSHQEYVLSTDSRLKGYEEKVAGLTGLELQVSTLKKQVSGLNDKLATFDSSFAKSKAKGKERKKKIKSLSKSLDNLHCEATPPEFSSFFRGLFQGLVRKFLASDEFSRVQSELLSLAASAVFERGLSMHRTKDEFADVLKKMVNFTPGAQERLVEAYLLVVQTDYAFLNKISKYVVEPLSVILQLEPEKLVHPAKVPIPRDTHFSPPIAKESTVTPISKSLELYANIVPASFSVALEQNEEQVSTVVDGSDLEMTDGVAHSKSEGVFVQGNSHVLYNVAEVTVVGSERVSSCLTDVVVALSAGENGDGSAASSTVEEVVVPPSEFGFVPSALLVALPFLLLLVSSTDVLVLIPTNTSWLRNSSFIVASPVNTSAFRFKIFGRCVIRNL